MIDTQTPTIVVTAGEPAGIGPELVARLAEIHRERRYPMRAVVIGDRDLLEQRAARIGCTPCFTEFDPVAPEAAGGTVQVWHLPVAVPVTPGQPDPANADHVRAMLARAADACAVGEAAALVTAPVQKSVLQDAGIPFTGHTEFFAERTHTPRVVMMLTGAGGVHPLRVALVTTHLALREVPDAITRPVVEETLRIVAGELVARFGIPDPRLAVCGLNPHAGEGGHFGREEIDVVAPAIAVARSLGIDVEGPLPADTVFVPSKAARFDAIVAMYHDQGLPVLKAATFGNGINVTLGLPFIRTSVDHGTALDLAADADKARGADPGSLVAAVELALELATRSRRG